MCSREQFVTFCLLLILSLSAGCGGSKQAYEPSESRANLDKTWTMAIFPFKTMGESKLPGEEAMNLMSTELIGVKGLRIVDRVALKEVLEKYGFELGRLENPEDRAEIGKLLGAQLICFGYINETLKSAAARVVFTETGEVLIAENVDGKKEINNVKKLARRIKSGIADPEVVAILNENSSKKQDIIPPPSTVEVKGYGAIVDGDIITAKKLALKDAYANAIDKVCGLSVSRQMVVEKYIAVRDMIFAESAGYVSSYEVLDENPDTEFGYEVAVRASVSRQPISDLGKLKLVVRYLYAEPRIMVLINGSIKGNELGKNRADVIAGSIGSKLKEAGFLVVDPETIEERKMEIEDSGSDEYAAQLGSLLDADLVVRGTLDVEITDRIEEIDGKKMDFPIISATTTGVFRIIRPQTAEIIVFLDHDAIPPDRKRGTGNTDDGAIENSINGFISASANKLAWELASKLGESVKMNLEMRNITKEQAQQLEQQLQSLPKHIVLEAKMEQHEENTAVYYLTTSVGSQTLEQKLRELVDPAKLGAKGLILEKTDFGSIIMSLET